MPWTGIPVHFYSTQFFMEFYPKNAFSYDDCSLAYNSYHKMQISKETFYIKSLLPHYLN